MKKLLIIMITLATVVSVNAQDGASITPTKKMTIAESRQNAPKEPTYQDGKPYSQWVAEEKAKQQAQPKTLAANQSPDLKNANKTVATSVTQQQKPDYFANPNSTRLGAPAPSVIDQPVIETKPERKPVEGEKVVIQPKDLTKSTQPTTTQTVPFDNGVKLIPAEKPVKKD